MYSIINIEDKITVLYTNKTDEHKTPFAKTMEFELPENNRYEELLGIVYKTQNTPFMFIKALDLISGEKKIFIFIRRANTFKLIHFIQRKANGKLIKTNYIPFLGKFICAEVFPINKESGYRCIVTQQASDKNSLSQLILEKESDSLGSWEKLRIQHIGLNPYFVNHTGSTSILRINGTRVDLKPQSEN